MPAYISRKYNNVRDFIQFFQIICDFLNFLLTWLKLVDIINKNWELYEYFMQCYSEILFLPSRLYMTMRPNINENECHYQYKHL